MKKKTENSNGKPKLKREWVRRYVKLLRQLETNGEVIFPAGEIMKVVRNHQGLTLKGLHFCSLCAKAHRETIAGISENSVEMMPEDFQPDNKIFDFQSLQDEIGKWSTKEFKGRERVEQCIQHLKKEVVELEERPRALEEIADCFMLLCEIARHSGFNMKWLLKASADKLEICKQRKYVLTEEGLYEHVRE